VARIGLVQTTGIGDIIIALPIAAAFARRGDTVFWPVDAKFAEFLQFAAPYAEFIAVPSRNSPADDAHYLVVTPEAQLRERRCDPIHLLYSQLNGWEAKVQKPKLAEFLKFDEYKYAVAEVPFREKWDLELKRDTEREERLFKSLGVARDFICVHRRGSKFIADLVLPAEWQRDYQVVEIDERSSSPFDWISTLERAAKLVCVDSCFANLVEQLNLPNEKYLMLRSPGLLTPVLKNGWQFLA